MEISLIGRLGPRPDLADGRIDLAIRWGQEHWPGLESEFPDEGAADTSL